MGYKEITLKLPTDYEEEQLRNMIRTSQNLIDFTYQIDNKSLDARKKNDIHWSIRVGIISNQIKEDEPPSYPTLNISYRKRDDKAVVIGSGPAGYFAAFILQRAGINTILIERGAELNKRADGIEKFETSGILNPACSYPFGEGGAGTFSDGKLTSRTKGISKERQFIFNSYISAGAPKEIAYLRHPHLGSDNLKTIVRGLRESFINIGGTMLFETSLIDLKIKNQKVYSAITTSGGIEADYFIIACGNSAYETYRMLLQKGVQFQTKNFAIGSRLEHSQEIINTAQWGKKSLAGIKAAEYRLTSRGDGNISVYTFCMCPGGIIVPAAAYEHTNIVNGMSRYRRDGKFANAACVAAVHPSQLFGKNVEAIEALDLLEQLEENFYIYSKGYKAPYCGISDFINLNKRVTPQNVESSYRLGLTPAPLWELLPSVLSAAIRYGLKDFSKKIKGFETGIIMGLESKTSSLIQSLREQNGSCVGFENLYIAGEGSGHSGGIISSAADGIKAAMNILHKGENL